MQHVDDKPSSNWCIFQPDPGWGATAADTLCGVTGQAGDWLGGSVAQLGSNTSDARLSQTIGSRQGQRGGRREKKVPQS